VASKPSGADVRFREVMDAAPVMIWVADTDKLCTWFNKPWLEFTGRTMAQEVGNGWAEGVHPEDFNRCLDVYNGHFDARKQFRMRYRLRHNSGQHRWIDDIGIPSYLGDGSFVGYIGSCTEAHDSSSDLAHVISRTPFMLTRCTRDLRYLFTSPAYAEMIGRTPAEIVGKPIVEIMGEEGLREILPHVERVLRGERVEYECTVPFKGVGPRLLHVIYTPDRDAAGYVQGWVASIRDVSEERRGEDAQRLLANLVNDSDDAILSKTLDGRITSWNRAAERIFGYSSDDIIGRHVQILFSAEREHEDVLIMNQLRAGESTPYHESVRRRKDGSLIDVAVTVSPLRDAQGNLIGASSIVRDISDRKQAQRRTSADLLAMTLLRHVGAEYNARRDDLTHCLQETLDAGIAILSGQKGNIQIFDPASGALTIAVHRGFQSPFLDFFRKVRDEDDSACSSAMQASNRIIVEDVLQSEIFVGKPALQVLIDAGVRAVVASPLIATSGAVLGMISIHFSSPHRPGERELGLLDMLVRQAADYLEIREHEQQPARSQ